MTVETTNGSICTIYINSTLSGTCVSSYNAWAVLANIPFSKGDKVYYTGSVYSAKVRYYKLRDYSDR